MFQWLHSFKMHLRLNHVNRILEHNYCTLEDAILELHESKSEKRSWEIIFNVILPCVSTVSEYFEQCEGDVWCDSVMWNELAIKIKTCQTCSTASRKSYDSQGSLKEIVERLEYLQKYSAHYITFDAYIERPFV